MATKPPQSCRSSPSFVASGSVADVTKLLNKTRRANTFHTLSSSAMVPLFDNYQSGGSYQTRGVHSIGSNVADTQTMPAIEDTDVGYCEKELGGGGNGQILVLFRGDLRLDDNPILVHALEEGENVFCLYCFDERYGIGRNIEDVKENIGIMERGRVRFLRECVVDIREGLRKRGGDLIVRHGIPENIVIELVKELRCSKVFLQKDVTFHGMCVEDALERNLRNLDGGIELKKFWSNTLYGEEDLPFDVRDIPNAYTEFRTAAEERGTVRVPLNAPEKFPPLPERVDPGEIPTLSQLGCREGFTANIAQYYYGVGAFVGGEREALKRVEDYVLDLSRIDADFSPHTVIGPYLGSEFSNRVSPWLALGCVSPRRIYQEMKQKVPSIELLLKSSTCRELIWRDFFKYTTYLKNCSVFMESRNRGVGVMSSS